MGSSRLSLYLCVTFVVALVFMAYSASILGKVDAWQFSYKIIITTSETGNHMTGQKKLAGFDTPRRVNTGNPRKNNLNFESEKSLQNKLTAIDGAKTVNSENTLNQTLIEDYLKKHAHSGKTKQKLLETYYMKMLPQQNMNSSVNNSCQEIKLSTKKLPLVALAAFPGAGSSWVKHLLQQATGIYSGSSLSDYVMSNGEFKYQKVYDGSVTPIKTHKRGDQHLSKKVDYDKAIVLLRSPYECMKANYQRKIAGKTGVIPPELFDEKNWLKMVLEWSIKWIDNVVSWLIDPRPIFLLKFDDLKSNLPFVLRKAATFLNLDTTDAMLNCTKINSEGSWHRTKDPNQTELLLFPDSSKEDLDNKIAIVDWYIQRRCPTPPRCLLYKDVNFTGQPYKLNPVS